MTTEYAVDTADTAFAVAVARAWQDERFLADLTRDPAAVMASLGYEAPVGLTMDVLVDTPQVNHLVLAQSTRD